MNGCRRLPLVNDARGNDPSIMQDAVRVGIFSKGIDENANLANRANSLKHCCHLGMWPSGSLVVMNRCIFSLQSVLVGVSTVHCAHVRRYIPN